MHASPRGKVHHSCRQAFLPAPTVQRPRHATALRQRRNASCSRGAEALRVTRRDALRAALLLTGPAQALCLCRQAQASKLGPGVDKAWESFGGGPPDLFFPEDFEGTWLVQSTLTGVEFPFGEKFVPDIRTANRALQEDYQRPIDYRLAFRRNPQGRIVLDRQFNTAALLSHYYGSFDSIMRNVRWDSSDPNEISVQLPSGGGMQARVTRRSREAPDSWRIETSEFYRQTFSNPDGAMSRVKASQCFTKYKFRTRAQAGGGPQIVATQVVSDFLTAMDDQTAYMKTMNRPVVTYTYKMTFARPGGSQDQTAVRRDAGLQE